MVTVLKSGASSLGSSPGWEHCVVFSWARHFTLTMMLFTLMSQLARMHTVLYLYQGYIVAFADADYLYKYLSLRNLSWIQDKYSNRKLQKCIAKYRNEHIHIITYRNQHDKHRLVMTGDPCWNFHGKCGELKIDVRDNKHDYCSIDYTTVAFTD